MQKSRLNVGNNKTIVQNVIARTIQRHGDNRNQRPQERNEQRNQGSERRNNRPDQRRGEQAQVAPKLISKRVQQH